MKQKHVLLIFAALLIFPVFLPAQTDPEWSAELNLQMLGFRTRTVDADLTPYWAGSMAGSAGLVYEGGTRNVKAETAFSFAYPEIDMGLFNPALEGQTYLPVGIDRLYVKSRIAFFRFTLGKTRLAWGDGFVFNAGDVLFGSSGSNVDLTADEIRGETEWLVALNVPLTHFSFIELLAMAPGASVDDGKSAGDLRRAPLGGRFYTKWLNIKWEAGYLWQGNEWSHKPYAALQGNLLVDWYLNASTALNASDGWRESFQENLMIAGGLFNMYEITRLQKAGFRLEALLRPWQEWTEKTDLEPGDEQPLYALLLYPELIYSPSETVTISARAIVAPIDRSAQILGGISWNVLQGYTLSLNVLGQAGDGDDLFPWQKPDALWLPGTDRIDGIAVIAGVSYIY